MNRFITEELLPFLHYEKTVEGISLKVTKQPIVQPMIFDDLFETLDLSDASIQLEFVRRIAAIKMASRIATETRRAAGNMLWVPDQEMKDWFEAFPHNNFEVIVDKCLASNELRCAYFKLAHGASLEDGSTKVVAVDGGVQFAPEGFSCLPNYKAYFKRCFL